MRAPRAPHRRSAAPGASGSAPFTAMLDGALRPTLICVPVVVAAFWVTRHAAGAGAAALGCLLAVVFFGAGLYVMTRLVGDNPLSLLASALAVYLGQVLLLGGVILTLSGASWLDGVAFGLAALAVTLLWQAFSIRAFLRARKDVYDVAAAVADAGAPVGPR